MKNSRIRSYIDGARASVAQNPSSARTLNWAGNGGSNFVSQPLFNQTGDGAKRSMPYVINVTNASSDAVNNFDVLGSYEYLGHAGWQPNGDLTIGAVTISSGIPGVTYQQFLHQAQVQPFTVGMTYLQCANKASQVQTPFTIVTKDANGTQLNIPIVPAVDPYQQLSDINIVEQVYRIDGYTKLTFSSIVGDAVLTIRFYPEDNLNPARAISGQSAVKTFSNPGIIRK